jgi:anti-anti-sigma factor
VAVQDEEIDATTHLFRLGEAVSTFPPGGLIERIHELIESGKTHFLIDLSELTFEDDLRFVLRLDEAVRSAGGSVVLLCPDEPTRRVFAITRLDERIPVHSSRQAAMAAIAARAKGTQEKERE